MDHTHMSGDRHFTLVPQRRGPLRALRELWCSHDRRRQSAQLGRTGRHRHPLDEGYVVDAMPRQIEEIRNLPEVAR